MIQSWHLPHVAGADAAPRRRLAATPLDVPVLSHAQVERQWEGMDAAAAAWRQQPAAARVERIAAVAAALRAAGPGDAAAWLARSTGLSPAGLAAAWEVTFASCDAPALATAVDAEPDAIAAGGARVLHVMAGNVLPPTWTMLVRGFLVGAPQWLRPAAREPLFAACVAAQLRALAPELAAMLAVSWWPHGDTAVEPHVLAAAAVVTVQGDDASVEAVCRRAADIAPQARCIGFGARWSAAVVARGEQTAATAAALARDVALFDGQGCLSPALVFAEDGAALGDWCAELAAALAEREQVWPRGTLDAATRAALRAWREEARLGWALGSHRGLWESAATSAWAVALQHDLAWPETPLDRHIAVLPFAACEAVRAACGAARLGRLQGLAVAWESWDAGTRAAWTAALHPTRIAAVGTLQQAPPGWRQDHHAPLASLIAAPVSRR